MCFSAVVSWGREKDSISLIQVKMRVQDRVGMGKSERREGRRKEEREEVRNILGS